MGFAKSTRAQNKIRYWLNIHQRERAIEMGKKLLEKQARKYRLALKDFNDKTMDTIAKEYGLGGGQDLLPGNGTRNKHRWAILSRSSRGISYTNSSGTNTPKTCSQGGSSSCRPCCQ